MLSSAFDTLEADVRHKVAACEESLENLGTVVVAFSGGVDSTFLLALAAKALGRGNVLAVTGLSPSLAQRERRSAEQLAGQIGVELIEVCTGEMDDPDFVANTPDRCYHCKRELFCRLNELARQRGFNAVASGANADDAGDYRPGLRAGRELHVHHPLMDAGLSKSDIRAASRAMGLKTWNKPAMACLASRIPYGEAITEETLKRIEHAEYLLRDLGFTQCRVRDHDAIARIELPPEAMSHVMEHREVIVDGLRELGYTYVTLDLQGFRSGSMNEVLQ